MIAVTYVPLFVTILFRGMPGIWKSRHRLILCWLVFMQALYPRRKTLAELARWTPASLTAWRFPPAVEAPALDWALAGAGGGPSNLYTLMVCFFKNAAQIPWPAGY